MVTIYISDKYIYKFMRFCVFKYYEYWILWFNEHVGSFEVIFTFAGERKVVN
jgi:hypothetical protein